MLPIKSIRLQIGDLLAADTTTLAPVAANKIALIAAPFVENEALAIGDLVFATFTGSTPKAGAAGPQTTGVDPATGEQLINILPPAGGYIFKCTVAPVTPEIIYGYALVDNAVAVLLAVQRFVIAITIQAVNDQVDCEVPEMRIVSRPIS